MTASFKTRSIVLISLTVALTAAGAWIRIPVGPVPISLQTLLVLLSGAILGPLLGASAMLVYIALGLIGLPVFTAGGGPGYFVSPTFGFLVSFPLAALVVGLIHGSSSSIKNRRLRQFTAFTAGTAVIYMVGVPWLWMNLKLIQGKTLGAGALLMVGMVPFLPGDFLKIVLASFLSGPISRTIGWQRV